ncbi:MAG: hypothetical protein U0V56_08165 [Actinomycetota bacterium]
MESEGISTSQQDEQAEGKDRGRGADEFITPDELRLVIDDLRAGRRPAILEDPEP